jgi:GGDEF domain-containing protein
MRDAEGIAGDRSAGEAAASIILERVREPIAIAGQVADVRASIGGTWTNAKRDVTQLLEEAAALLYNARAAGRDAVRFQ